MRLSIHPSVRTLALMGILFAATTLHALEPDEQLQFADGLYARKLYSLAVPEYVSFLKQSPGHAKADVAYYRLGECYRLTEKAADAEKAFSKVFTQYRKSTYRLKAGFKLAELKMEARNYEAAVTLLRSLLKEKPPEDLAAASLYFLGNSLLKLDKTKDAISALEELTRKYSSSSFASPALLMLGNIYATEKGGARKAVVLYRRAAEKPSSERVGAEAWFQLAELYLREKSYEPSAEAYDKLFSLYPKDERVPAAQLSASWALHNAGRYADALKRIASVTGGKPERDKHGDEWLYLEANCQRQLLNYKQASRAYTRLLGRYPRSRFVNASIYENALALHKSGKYGDAIKSLKSFRPGEEQKKDVYWLLAEAYAALKDDNNAIQYYRMLIEQYPKSNLSCDAGYRLAYLLQKRKEYKEASKWYLVVAREFPKEKIAPQSLFASAYCQSKAGRHEAAVRDWAALISDYPESPLVEDAAYQKAMSEAFLRRDKQAEATLRDLLKRFPKTRFAADSHLWLGVLLKESGREEKAVDEFRTALSLKPAEALKSEIQFHLGLCLQKLKKHDEAADLFGEVLASKNRSKLTPGILEWLAEHRHGQKKYADALSAAELLADTAKQPEWRQIGWCLAGRSYLADGQEKKAVGAFKKSLAIPVKTRYACESALRLGELVLAGKDYKECRQYFEKAAELASDDALVTIRAHAYAGLARSFKAEKKWEEAARHFMSVAILFDDPELVPECLYEAAAANAELGRDEARREALRELVERYPDSKWAKESQQ